MYTNAFYDRSNGMMHLWDDETGYSKQKFERYAFIEDDSENTKLRNLYGKPVKKIKTGKMSYERLSELKLYESDIDPEMRFLIDTYYDKDDTKLAKNKIVCFDIETELGYTFPDMETTENKIISIAKYDYDSERYTVYVLDEQKEMELKINKENVDILTYQNELDMLTDFINNLKCTILTGWNIEFFDIPYLIRRVYKISGDDRYKNLSPISNVLYSEYKKRYIVAGVSILDYMSLYKKFRFGEEPSFTLDFISKKELGRGKVEYNGRLNDLFKTDINKFIEYNIGDVELVVSIDKKRKFIDYTIMLCQKGRIPYENVFMSSSYIDGAIICFLKKKGLVAPNRKGKTGEDSPFIGAFVKEPTPGLYKWVYDLDMTSLYPSILMSLNISPETKLFKIDNWIPEKFYNRETTTWFLTKNNSEDDDNQQIELDSDTLYSMIDKNQLHVSINGVVYKNKQTNPGIIPTILELWFEERVKYKNSMKKCLKENDNAGYEFFDKLQFVQKTLLNTVYGVLGQRVNRFYDLDNATAVTLTGQHIIKYTQDKGNEYYYNKLGTKGDFCIYQDTDSVAGESLIRTNTFGVISISECYSELSKIEDPIIDPSGREFIFPENLKLPYYNEDNKQIENGNVEFIERHKVKKKFFKLKTKSGKEIIVTEDHSVMILNGDNLIEKKPEMIKINDRVLVINNLDDEIVSIEEVDYFDEVYDIGMKESPHTFFANDILVHNSCFFSGAEFVKGEKDYDKCKKIVMKNVNDIQKYINQSYSDYAKRYMNIDKHKFEVKQELICSVGFWVEAKKRYALKVINREGVDIEKYDFKGFEIVKSSFPQAFKDAMKSIIIGILDDKDKKEIDNIILDIESNIETYSFKNLAKITSINNISDYNKQNHNNIYYKNKTFSDIPSGTPAHVKAAIYYNDMLNLYGIKNVPHIKDGEKIKWVYLKPNPYRLEMIGFRGYDDPKEILDFIDKFCNKKLLYEKEMKNKIESIYDALKWSFPNKNQNSILSFLIFE